jgi:DNA mismatch repair protein MutS2
MTQSLPDCKSRETLEFPRVLSQLASFTAFSAGRELALRLEPASDREEVIRRLEETREARWLLSAHPGTRIGGVHDVRQRVANARLSAMLTPSDFLELLDTLQAGRRLQRAVLRAAANCPHLARIARQIEPCKALTDEILRCLDDNGEVKDDASSHLAEVRSELTRCREKLRTRLEQLVRAPENLRYLQEPLITQRSGRYVIPLKAEHKGRIPGVVHDQSASGATLFVEPLATLEINNRCRQLEIAERHEVERILRSLSNLVAENGDEIIWTVEALARLDLAFAKAEYAESLRATRPEIGDSPSLDLRDARHPLLDAETVVPISVRAGHDFTILVITGPNTGGKTVTLKTVGLLALMTQSGLHIPAGEGSRMAVFSGIYADIGDEQSIEQNLSTFSGHLQNIVRILEGADERSLVLLDELGAGTDPIEGAALARALLAYLLRRRITSLVATHYSELKVFAQVTPGVTNASLAFDLETLSPTYELTIGLPGRSSALAIAERLGLDSEIIAEAEQAIAPENLELDEMISAIRIAEEEAAKMKAESAAAREQAEELERLWRSRLAELEAERLTLRNEAREEARAELEAVRRRIRALAQRAESLGRPLEDLATLRREARHIEKTLEPLSVPPPPPPAPPLAGTPEIGDTVWVSSLQRIAEVVSIGEEEVEVQAGSFRLRVPPEQISLRAKGQSRGEGKAVQMSGLRTYPSPGTEIDLRGYTVDEALPVLDKYLDEAYLAGLPRVRIIHGKGTGALRRMTRQELSNHPLVTQLRAGDRHEGGDGVTVAEIVAG